MNCTCSSQHHSIAPTVTHKASFSTIMSIVSSILFLFALICFGSLPSRLNLFVTGASAGAGVGAVKAWDLPGAISPATQLTEDDISDIIAEVIVNDIAGSTDCPIGGCDSVVQGVGEEVKDKLQQPLPSQQGDMGDADSLFLPPATEGGARQIRLGETVSIEELGPIIINPGTGTVSQLVS